MYGICGIYNKGNTPVTKERIIRMMDIMIDQRFYDADVYMGPNIGLGRHCLSIIDLSQSEQQPMCNEDGKIWSVVNGDIYNFMELKEKLVKTGHVFKSRTDCEVIVHGYEEWGEDVFEKIDGKFAIVIWDSVKEILILARDRVGQELLFYTESNGTIMFASDIKSIMEGMGKSPEIDYKAMDAFLCHLCVPHPFTIFKEIKKISPAHYIVFSKNDTRIKKYWHLNFRKKIYMRENEYLDKIEDLLKESITKRLPNNIQAGVFLSGGIDSSLIVALMSELSGDKVKTFSVGFDYKPYNELEYTKKIVDRYSTDHHTLMVGVNDLNIIPKLIWNYGEPFADSSAIPSYYISKVACEYIKVALVGDGADESFAGYPRTMRFYYAYMYKKRVPRFLSNFFISPFFKVVGAKLDGFYLTNRVRLYENYLNDTIRVRYGNLMGCAEIRDKLYSDKFKMALNSYDSSHIYDDNFNMEDGIHEIDKALFVDINTRLPNDYLVKMNIASASNSLKVRAPFLDYHIMEFAAKIPPLMKLKKGTSKYLLKEIAKKYIPKENVNRPKWGFSIPLEVWFRKELKHCLYSIILSNKAKKRNYFNYEYVDHIINEHLAGRVQHEHRLWALLWLELWHRMFIDKEINPSNSLRDLI